MADQAQDRNLPATPRKLEKARGEGQVARSRDLGHFTAIAAGGALLFATAPLLSAWLQRLLAQGLQFDRAAVQNPGFMGTRLLELTTALLWVVRAVRRRDDGRGVRDRRRDERLELDLQADPAEVRQVQSADRRGPAVREGAADRCASRPARWR